MLHSNKQGSIAQTQRKRVESRLQKSQEYQQSQTNQTMTEIFVLRHCDWPRMIVPNVESESRRHAGGAGVDKNARHDFENTS